MGNSFRQKLFPLGAHSKHEVPRLALALALACALCVGLSRGTCRQADHLLELRCGSLGKPPLRFIPQQRHRRASTGARRVRARPRLGLGLPHPQPIGNRLKSAAQAARAVLLHPLEEVALHTDARLYVHVHK